MKTIIPINPMHDQTCRTIKSQYKKISIANLIRTGAYAATGVLEIIRYEEGSIVSIPDGA